MSEVFGFGSPSFPLALASPISKGAAGCSRVGQGVTTTSAMKMPPLA